MVTLDLSGQGTSGHNDALWGRCRQLLVFSKDGFVATLIIEIHVPFPSEPVVAEDEYPFPWIDAIEDFLNGLAEEGEIEVFDDGEEYGNAYVFFITGADQRDLLAVASRTANLEGVPPGVFAMISDDEAAEWGLGRRVDLPLS